MGSHKGFVLTHLLIEIVFVTMDRNQGKLDICESTCMFISQVEPTRLMLVAPSWARISATSAWLIPAGAGIHGLPPGWCPIVHCHRWTSGRLSPCGGLLLLWVGFTPSCRKRWLYWWDVACLLLLGYHSKSYFTHLSILWKNIHVIVFFSTV